MAVKKDLVIMAVKQDLVIMAVKKDLVIMAVKLILRNSSILYTGIFFKPKANVTCSH